MTKRGSMIAWAARLAMLAKSERTSCSMWEHAVAVHQHGLRQLGTVSYVWAIGG
jgi:hypothetical protein